MISAENVSVGLSKIIWKNNRETKARKKRGKMCLYHPLSAMVHIHCIPAETQNSVFQQEQTKQHHHILFSTVPYYKDPY